MYKIILFILFILFSCKEQKQAVKKTNNLPSVVIHKVPANNNGPFFLAFVKDGTESVRKQDSIFLDYTNDNICYAKDSFLYYHYAINENTGRVEGKLHNIWIVQHNKNYKGVIGTFFCFCEDTTKSYWNYNRFYPQIHEVYGLFLNNQHNNVDSIEREGKKIAERKICPRYISKK